MDVYQNIWTNCDKTQLEKHNQLISESVINLGLFQNEDERLLKVYAREINSLLNTPKTRDRGLRLLIDLVPQCSQQVLSEQCERWFRFCSDAVAAGRKTRNFTQACQVLTALLKDLSHLPELQRCVTSKSSASIVVDLASTDHGKCPATLKCLYEYIRAAPGQCLQHKKLLEGCMLHHLDNPIGTPGLEDLTKLAGRVYAALPLPGVGGGNMAQTRADGRGRQLTLLLALAHSLMDSLFDGVVERESHPHSREHSTLQLRPLEEITQEPVSSRLAIIARLSNTLKFVGEMITDPANTAVTITIDQLLGVPFRLLQVEAGILSRYKSQEHKLLAFFLPSLHHQALLLLRDVITSLSEGIDCYSGVLGDLLMSVLQAKDPGAKGRPVWCSGGQQTRVVTYAVLAELLRVSRGRHAPPSSLVTVVLKDASPRTDEVKLQRQEKGLGSLSVHKAAGKKKGYTITSGSSRTYSGPLPRPDRFSRLARVALVVAEMMFTHVSPSMPHKDHLRLQEGVLGVAEVVVGTAPPPDIYSDPRTRVQLFLTLASLSTSPHPRCPPPYSRLTHLLQAGLSDQDTQVVSACQMALCAVSLIVANPRVEMSSRVFHQHCNTSNTHNSGETEEEIEEDEEEGGSIVEQEEEKVDEEEEPMIAEKTDKSKEEEKKEEKEKEIEEQNDEEEKMEEEQEEKSENEDKDKDKEEEETGGTEEEKEEKEDNKKKEKGGDKDKEEEEMKEEQQKEEGMRRRSRSRSRKQSSEVQMKTGREKTAGGGERGGRGKKEKVEEGGGGKGKRNGGKSDPPAKRVKSSDQGSSKEGSSSEFLTVEEMLKDFVDS